MQMATIPPSLFLLIFLWSTELGAEGQEVHFGSCWVQRAILRDLWRAFQAMKNTVVSKGTILSLTGVQCENNVWAEICHLTNSLLDFYLKNIFKNYKTKAAKLGILPPFMSLANNFFAILQKFKRCVSRAWGQGPGTRGLNPEVRLTKALGEVDILLTWMEKAFRS
uniref:Uncharacterized protein n=1 Tax=Monodelphis domestica TaxID=13616 RepID=F6XDH7_MONDO